MEQYITNTNLTKRWIFAVLDVQLYVAYNRVYKRRFLHLSTFIPCSYRLVLHTQKSSPVLSRLLLLDRFPWPESFVTKIFQELPLCSKKHDIAWHYSFCVFLWRIHGVTWWNRRFSRWTFAMSYDARHIHVTGDRNRCSHCTWCHRLPVSCCPRGLALASRILEDTWWRSWHLKASLGLGFGLKFFFLALAWPRKLSQQ